MVWVALEHRPDSRAFEITNKEGHPPTESLYRGTKSLTLIAFNYVLRDQTKRQYPEQFEKTVTATVFSGHMAPKKTAMTMREFASIPNG